LDGKIFIILFPTIDLTGWVNNGGKYFDISEIEALPQTLIFFFSYLCNPML